MANLERKSLDTPDETRRFVSNGQANVVTLSGVTVGRGVFEPGWKWSEHVKPIAGTASCMAPHSAYVISGRMHIVMNDGTETDVGPGDTFVAAPGHDAWVVGNEPCVMVDFSGMAQYAKQG